MSEHPVEPGDPFPPEEGGSGTESQPRGTEDPSTGGLQSILTKRFFLAWALLMEALGGPDAQTGGSGQRTTGSTSTESTVEVPLPPAEPIPQDPTPGAEQEGGFGSPVSAADLLLAGAKVLIDLVPPIPVFGTLPEGGTTVQIPGEDVPVTIPPDCEVVCGGGPPVGFGQFIGELGSAAIRVGEQFITQQLAQGQFPTTGGALAGPTFVFGGPAAGTASMFDPPQAGVLSELPEFLGGGLPSVNAPGGLFHRTPSGRWVANRMTRVANPGTGRDQYFLPAMPDSWRTPVKRVRGPRRHHHHPR